MALNARVHFWWTTHVYTCAVTYLHDAVDECHVDVVQHDVLAVIAVRAVGCEVSYEGVAVVDEVGEAGVGDERAEEDLDADQLTDPPTVDRGDPQQRHQRPQHVRADDLW